MFWLASVAILLALLSPIGVLVGSVFGYSISNPIVYEVTIALLCFSLSSISCLLFAAKVEVKATIGLIVVTIAGPAAMWAASLVILNKIYPPPSLSTETIVSFLRAQELSNGWLDFPAWLEKMGPVENDIKKDEANPLRQLMDTAYYLGSDADKLRDVTVQELFIYLGTQTIKIQRITGDKVGDAKIYVKADPTLAGGTKTLLLTKQGESISDAELGGNGVWVSVSSDPVDCLVITVYDEGMLAHGDILYVDTRKFIKSNESATLWLGIMAKRRIEQPRVWQLRGLPFPISDDIVPVELKSASAQSANNLDAELDSLSPWLKRIDAALANRNTDDAWLTSDVSQF